MMHSFIDGCLKGQLDKAAASFDDGLAGQQIIAAASGVAWRDACVRVYARPLQRRVMNHIQR
jgi:hypothetical protein